MATFAKTELLLDHKFDPVTCRHTMNGWCSVLHCHHYSALYTQLADDCGFMDAKKLLAEVSEDNFYTMLVSYFEDHNIEKVEDRISIAEQYYAAVGLGKLEVVFAGTESAEALLHHSHVDEGWKKKWGKRDKPVNFITCGYFAALLAATFDRSPRTFVVKETESIISGAERSRFEAAAV